VNKTRTDIGVGRFNRKLNAGYIPRKQPGKNRGKSKTRNSTNKRNAKYGLEMKQSEREKKKKEEIKGDMFATGEWMLKEQTLEE
jgi:hypothetical protein